MIPYGRQEITETDIDAVVDVLKSEYLTQGPTVPRFEGAVAAYCGASCAVAVNSATSALHIACMALGVGPGDFVWTSAITFVASANCALYCGANIDFIDIDPTTYNISIDELKEKLVIAQRDGVLPKVVIPVHMCGQSCDMSAIFRLSQIYGFRVIEDASHAIGGKYNGDRIGACLYSDITVFSFHPVKIITTGEGGMATTNNELLAERMRLFRSHGINSNKYELNSESPLQIWNYEQTLLGYNYRMTDIQAALGLSQLKRLDEYVQVRHEIAKRYDVLLKDLPLETPFQAASAYSSFHLYIIRLKLDGGSVTQRQVYDRLHLSGIKVNLHYIPVYRQPYFKSLGFDKGYCPTAEKYYLDALTLPLYPALKLSQQNHVAHKLKEYLSANES